MTENKQSENATTEVKKTNNFNSKDMLISLLTPVAGFAAAVVGGSLAAATTKPLIITYVAMAVGGTVANMLTSEYLVKDGKEKSHKLEFLAHMITTAAVVVGGAYMGLALPALLAAGACQTALWYGHDAVVLSKYNWTLAATLPIAMIVSTGLTATWASAFSLSAVLSYAQFYLMFVGATFLAKQFSENENPENKIVKETLNALPTVLVSALGLFAGVNPYALGLSAVFNLLALAGENGAFSKGNDAENNGDDNGTPVKEDDISDTELDKPHSLNAEEKSDQDDDNGDDNGTAVKSGEISDTELDKPHSLNAEEKSDQDDDNGDDNGTAVKSGEISDTEFDISNPLNTEEKSDQDDDNGENNLTDLLETELRRP
jgi:hypothetical protein